MWLIFIHVRSLQFLIQCNNVRLRFRICMNILNFDPFVPFKFNKLGLFGDIKFLLVCLLFLTILVFILKAVFKGFKIIFHVRQNVHNSMLCKHLTIDIDKTYKYVNWSLQVALHQIRYINEKIFLVLYHERMLALN